MVTGLPTACGLTTTLDLVVRCNIAIRPQFVSGTIVAYRLKSVFQLVTTLRIVICCNIAIKPWSDRYALVACRMVVV